jgi:hypothetical protein
MFVFFLQLIRENLPKLDLTDRSLYIPKPLIRKTPEELDEASPAYRKHLDNLLKSALSFST